MNKAQLREDFMGSLMIHGGELDDDYESFDDEEIENDFDEDQDEEFHD